MNTRVRVLSLIVFAFSVVLFSVSAQSVVIDFEGALAMDPCEPYIDSIGAGAGFGIEIIGGGGFDTLITDFGNFFAPAISGNSCLIIPSGSVVIRADGVFSGVTVGTSEVTVSVYDENDVLLNTAVNFTGFYTYNGPFKTIVLANTGGASPIFDNITFNFGVAPAPRLNEEDVAAPVALFCYPDGGIDIYTVANSEGTFLTRAFAADIVRARQQAESSGTNTAIYNDGAVSLWVLSTGETQVNAGNYVSIFDYEATCGPLPDVEDIARSLEPTPRPRDEFVIINRPR